MGQINIELPRYKILEPLVNEELLSLELLYSSGAKKKKYLKARQSTLEKLEALIDIDFTVRQELDITFDLEAETEVRERNIESIYLWVSNMEQHPNNLRNRNKSIKVKNGKRNK